MNALAPSMQTQPIDYAGLWHKSRLSVHDVIEKDPEVLKVGDVTICTLGNFSASIGKAKSKKTFNLSAIVAAALKGDMVVNYTGCFPPDKNKIPYVDTEQSDHHCNRVYKRIQYAENKEARISVGNWLAMFAESEGHLNDYESERAYSEVEDIATGKYNHRLGRGGHSISM